ncbi:hypothetical protein OQZ33_07075 [Pedobacter sp. MC2016-05]|uniref:hypothetical protein n=1 Tax=Pedobacter sp. MC2016-05 TaxID=2994474 RepID=UPI002247ED1A|nr:hypothetical protein [Pedobacter sp. MC2016-05]MCX2474087.1 hypothetical protein [Pedobacter sp. MC2016-05]
MAAPSSSFLNKNIHTINASGQQVGNSRAIPNDTPEVLKKRFYLDDLLITKDSDGNEGFTGLVNFNGANYKYHNPNRMGSLRSFNGDYQCNYTDAGLNTFAHAKVSETITTPANRIKLLTNFKSSFYDNSTLRGYQWRAIGGTWFTTTTTADTLTAQQTLDIIDTIYTSLGEPQLVEIRPWIENPEGRFYGDIHIVSVSEPIEPLRVEFRQISSGACSSGGELRDIFMRIPEFNRLETDVQEFATSTGIFAYANEDMILPATSGYYASLTGNINKVFYLTPDGEFVQWIYCQPTSVIKVSILVQVFASGYYSVSAVRTAQAGFNQSITISGGASAFIGSNPNPIGSIFFSVTIPENESQGTYVGNHSIDYVDQLSWEKGVFSVTDGGDNQTTNDNISVNVFSAQES